MNKPSHHSSFEYRESAHIKSLDIHVNEYRHKVTGTPHFHLATENTENAFLVGLRTIPTDSTGVAHILEHTVLCGSERYPVRDPFFMMIRRSLNTFMNAFTSSDWTAYPFASQNRKDYFNLLDVYLDAVFFSRLDELDFMQEGHRLEFETADDPTSDLTFKGVVFNEMKGAMSSPTSILWQTMSKHLFPNNTYHYNSGGDPEAIPDLTYQQLVDFYKTHYHPSNAVLMTFGDIPAEELQERFDTLALKRFEPLDRTVSVQPTQRFHAPIRVEEAYPTSDENLDKKTHIVLGWLLGETVDLDARLEAHLLSSILLDNSASPLLKALEQTDLGTAPSPLCGVEDSTRDMVFVCGLDGSEADNSTATEALILSVLNDVAKNSVPKEHVESILHQLELSQREIRGDGMPFGLQLLLGGLTSAMQRGDTLASLDLDPALERLREKTEDPAFIPGLVQRLLVDNPHRVRLTLRPDKAISERRNQAELQRLAKTQAQLNEEERQNIVIMAQKLAERQTLQDDPEILPKVGLADVPEDIHIPVGTSTVVDKTPAIHFNAGTNGLVYPQLTVEMPHLEDDLLAVLPLYSSFLTELGSGGRDYLETQNRQAAVAGGLSSSVLKRSDMQDEQNVSAYFALRGKALKRNDAALIELMSETMYSVDFSELTRLKELVAQSRVAREQHITGSGHSLAMSAAASRLSPLANLAHRLNGLASIQSIKALDDSLEDAAEVEALAEKFRAIHAAIQSAPRQFMWISEEAASDDMQAAFAQHFPSTNATEAFTAFTLPQSREHVQQLWTTSTEVDFCSKAFATVPSGHDDAAALTILGPFLRNGFLHRAIRETGGAYGGGATQDADTATFRFYSYRDPRLTDTLNDFDASIDWLLNTQHEDRALEESILNVVSSIDKPGSPAGEARGAYQASLFGRTPELRREFRSKILNVSMDDLKRAGERYLTTADCSVGVVTSEATAGLDVVKALGYEQHSI
jgi:presequence protease